MKKMETPQIVLVILVASIAVSWVLYIRSKLGKRAAGSQSSPKKTDEMFETLRGGMLQLTAEKLNPQDLSGTNGVFGVLMEMGLPEGSVTLVAFYAGDTSLYYSTGGGIIGAGGHETVRKAARDMNLVADKFVPRCKKTTTFPLPQNGEVVFYIKTKDGTYTASFAQDELANNTQEFSPLFYAGNEVITQVRLTTGGKL